MKKIHLGFTMYTTCVIWLAFVPLYFGTGNHVPLRLTSMSVTISLSASVTVACLFSPKVSNSYAFHTINYCSSTNNLSWLCGWRSASSYAQKPPDTCIVCVCMYVFFYIEQGKLPIRVSIWYSVWYFNDSFGWINHSSEPLYTQIQSIWLT